MGGFSCLLQKTNDSNFFYAYKKLIKDPDNARSRSRFHSCPRCIPRHPLCIRAISAECTNRCEAFQHWPEFGIPTFQPKNTDDDKGKGDTEEKKIDMKGLAQLITAGMGSPFLGDFEGVDKDTGTLNFSPE